MPDSPLGRGLSSLIPQTNNNSNQPAGQKPAGNLPQPTFQNATTKESVFHVETDNVEPNPMQPRRDFDEEALKDLAESIRRHGIIQPLVVTKREISTPRGQEVRYELIAGERRLKASRLAGLKHVPVVIRAAEEQQKLEVALVENLQRHNLSP